MSRDYEPLAFYLRDLNSLQITKVREYLRAEYDRGFKDGQSAGVLDGEIKQLDGISQSEASINPSRRYPRGGWTIEDIDIGARLPE
jgi:hypothetical protein